MIGGQEIRQGILVDAVGTMLNQLGGIDRNAGNACREELNAIDGSPLPGRDAGHKYNRRKPRLDPIFLSPAAVSKTWESRDQQLGAGEAGPLSDSSLAAIGRLDLGLPDICFTPSLGSLPGGKGFRS